MNVLKIMIVVFVVSGFAVALSCSNTEEPNMDETKVYNPTKIMTVYYEGEYTMDAVDYQVSITEDHYAIVEKDPTDISFVTALQLDSEDGDTAIIAYDYSMDDSWDTLAYCGEQKIIPSGATDACVNITRMKSKNWKPLGSNTENGIDLDAVSLIIEGLNAALLQNRKNDNRKKVFKRNNKHEDFQITYDAESK